MAELSTKWPTILDVTKRLDPNGSISAVGEILNQTNEILDDIPWMEGNLPTGHKYPVRASIPTPTWRLLNSGVQPVKSATNQFTDVCGMMENYSEIDKDLAMLNGNTEEWRLSEDKPIIEGMNQDLGYNLIYGDTSVNPEKFVGLAPRFWTKTAANSALAANVIDAGGTSADNTSIWLVGWAPETVFGIYPKGSKGGLQVQNLGEQTLTDANGGRYQGYRTHYQWKCGLVVKDWRYVVRIANIDYSALLTAGDGSDSSANLLKYMSMALDYVPNLNGAKFAFYMHNTVRAMLRVKLMNKSNTFLSLDDWTSSDGISRKVLSFQGIPCRRIDKLSVAEATLS
jgi:hypothetical protein